MFNSLFRSTKGHVIKVRSGNVWWYIVVNDTKPVLTSSKGSADVFMTISEAQAFVQLNEHWFSIYDDYQYEDK